MSKITHKLKMWLVPCLENDYRPVFLDSDFLIYFILILLVLNLAVIPAVTLFPKSSFFAEISKAIILELTNKQRQEMGLPALKENIKLNQSALLKARDIINFDYFSHNSPQGKSPWYWFQISGYSYSTAGENLGIGFLDSEEIYDAWNNSSSHKANLIDSRFEEIGIAIVEGNFNGNETTIVVQHFASPKIEIKPAVAEVKQEKSANEISLGPESTTSAETAEVAGIETEQKTLKEKNIYLFNIIKFLNENYSDLIKNIELFSLIFVILSLAMNVFVSIKVQHKDLICKAAFFAIVLAIFILINKELAIKIIPHSLFY